MRKLMRLGSLAVVLTLAVVVLAACGSNAKGVKDLKAASTDTAITVTFNNPKDVDKTKVKAAVSITEGNVNYMIIVQEKSADAPKDTDWTRLKAVTVADNSDATTGSSDWTYTEAGLTPDTQYKVYIRTITYGATEEDDTLGDIVTIDKATVLGAPEVTVEQKGTEAEVTFTVTKLDGATGYEYALVNDGVTDITSPSWKTLSVDATTGKVDVTVDSSLVGKTVEFQVRAISANGKGVATAPISVEIVAAPTVG